MACQSLHFTIALIEYKSEKNYSKLHQFQLKVPILQTFEMAFIKSTFFLACIVAVFGQGFPELPAAPELPFPLPEGLPAAPGAPTAAPEAAPEADEGVGGNGGDGGSGGDGGNGGNGGNQPCDLSELLEGWNERMGGTRRPLF
jgi:hypothetical protein